jgi:O-methyltransferase involved in polyketide biosynthesis
MSDLPGKRQGDLLVTALYTSQAWVWGGFDGAELLATRDAKTVFDVTNLFLGFIRLFRRQQPLLRHSLAQRHTMIDRLLEASQATQVVELAAGLSRRGPSVSKRAEIEYVEVDLPDMIAKKRALLARTDAGRAVLERPNLHFCDADLRDAVLDPYVDASRPLCVIAEGLFMYFQADEQRRLWTKIASAMRRAPTATFLFDLVPSCEQPKPGMLDRALGWLMKRFTQGKTFELDARTRQDITRDLTACGFSQVELFEPATCAAWALPHATKPTQVLIFRCRT